MNGAGIAARRWTVLLATVFGSILVGMSVWPLEQTTKPCPSGTHEFFMLEKNELKVSCSISYYQLAGPESFDARVVRVEMLARNSWELTLFISNTGKREVAISSIEVETFAGQATGIPVAYTDVKNVELVWSDIETGAVLKPGQSNFARISGDFGSAGDSVFITLYGESTTVSRIIKLP